MSNWHSETDRVELFPEVIDNRTQFLVMWVKNGEPVSTAADPCEFLHHMSPDYGAAILVAESLARANGVEVYDRVAGELS